MRWDIVIQTVSTAAVGICRRRGLCKNRHLAAADLWVQDRLRTKDFALVKVLGSGNVADVLTKHVPRPVLCKHMHSMGLVKHMVTSEKKTLGHHKVSTLKDAPYS